MKNILLECVPKCMFFSDMYMYIVKCFKHLEYVHILSSVQLSILSLVICNFVYFCLKHTIYLDYCMVILFNSRSC